MTLILVTGVSGFLGRNVAAYFTETGHDVIGLSRTDPNIQNIEWVQGDLSRPVARYLPGDVKTATVVHCAALAKDGRLSPQYYEANVEGTKNALNINPEGKFIHISSSSVYDLSHDSYNVEEDQFNVQGYKFYNGYGYTKALAEAEVLSLPRAVPSVTLRPHAIYGTGDTNLLPKLMARVKNGKLVLPDGGHVLHSLTHVENVIQAVSLATTLNNEQNIAFNITDNSSVMLRDALYKIVPELKHITNIPTKLLLAVSRTKLISEYEIRQVGFNRTYSLDKAREMLNYSPTDFVEKF